jgi:hypothetical protein
MELLQRYSGLKQRMIAERFWRFKIRVGEAAIAERCGKDRYCTEDPRVVSGSQTQLRMTWYPRGVSFSVNPLLALEYMRLLDSVRFDAIRR